MGATTASGRSWIRVPSVQGRLVDLYMWSCHDALKFGRRPVQLTVLRLGWNPQNSAPGRIGTLFKQRETESLQSPVELKPDDPSAVAAPTVVPAANQPPPL